MIETYDKYFPNPFIFGSLGVASVKGQYVGSFVNDIYDGSAVALGLVFIIFTSYIIHLDCRSYIRKSESEWKRLIFPIVGQIISWSVIVISNERIADHIFFAVAMALSYVCGYLFYKEVL